MTCIIFGSKRNLDKVSEFSVDYGNIKIGSQQCVRYLGVTIDQCLSGDAMAISIILYNLDGHIYPKLLAN